MQEVIGAQVDKTITNDVSIILAGIKMNLPIRWLRRKEMEFMAMCDLGARWEQLAKSPTLFLLDKEGKPHERRRD